MYIPTALLFETVHAYQAGHQKGDIELSHNGFCLAESPRPRGLGGNIPVSQGSQGNKTEINKTLQTLFEGTGMIQYAAAERPRRQGLQKGKNRAPEQTDDEIKANGGANHGKGYLCGCENGPEKRIHQGGQVHHHDQIMASMPSG